VTCELNKISHRTYSTGFFYGKPKNSQTYPSAGYIRDYAVAAVVERYADGMIIASLKNKFFRGTQLDCLSPKMPPFTVPTDVLLDENGCAIESAPHPTMIVKIPYPEKVESGSLLRMKSE